MLEYFSGCITGMVKQKHGAIVIMSSVTGYMVADPGEAAYATSKAALIGLLVLWHVNLPKMAFV